MYTLFYSDKALKQLEKLEKELQERMLASLERCRILPYNYVKKLVENPYYRLRVGDYRIILDIKNNQLQILVIGLGHWKNIYD